MPIAISLSETWANVYSLTGVEVGSPLVVVCDTGSVLFSVSQDIPTDNAQDALLRSGEEASIPGGPEPVWARAVTGKAVVYAQQDRVQNRAIRRFPFFDPRVIDGGKAFTVQPYTEYNVKRGFQFYVRAVWPASDPILAGQTRRLFAQTGDKPVIAKLRDVHYNGSEFKIDLFSNPTDVTGGTTLDVTNWNPGSGVVSTVVWAKDVTTTSDGVPLSEPEYFFGSTGTGGRTSGSIPEGRERHLPPNTAFIVAITNTDSGNGRFQYTLDWFEGDNSLNIP